MQDGQRRASQGAQFEQGHSLEVTFADMEQARSAIVELGKAGIEGQHITLRGPAAESAAEEPPTRLANRGPDERLFAGWFERVAKGAAIGALVGTAVLTPVGIAVLLLMGESITVTSVTMMAVAGALGGSIVFGLIAQYSALGQQASWELTFHDYDGGDVTLVVSSDNDLDISRARNVLERSNGVDIREGSGQTSGHSMPRGV